MARNEGVHPIFRPLIDSLERARTAHPTGRVPRTDPLELHIRHGLEWLNAGAHHDDRRVVAEAAREFKLAARHAFRKRPDLRPPTSAAVASGRRRHARSAKAPAGPFIRGEALPPAVKLDAEWWLGGRFSARLLDAETGETVGGCTHRHRGRAAAITCGRRILARSRKGA